MKLDRSAQNVIQKANRLIEFLSLKGSLDSVMSEYHKIDTNKYPNIFGCHIMYRTNIRINSDATYLAKE